MLTVPEAINHPQINSRDILQPVDLPGSGLMMLPRTPYHMSETPTRITERVAMLGEDNHAILSKDLGFTASASANWPRKECWGRTRFSPGIAT